MLLSGEFLAGEGEDAVGDRGKVGGDVLEREDVTRGIVTGKRSSETSLIDDCVEGFRR